MKDYTISGITMVIVGVLLIVIGGGTALGGMNKMDAADKWEESQTETDCRTTYNIDENASAEEIERQIQTQARQQAENGNRCTEIEPTSNPYSGGEQDLVIGGVLVVVGGTSTYFGNKR
jgi:hypothetical protein